MHEPVTAMTSTRSWRLEAFARGESKKPAHSSVVVGDDALDLAMRPLEADPSIVKITVRPA